MGDAMKLSINWMRGYGNNPWITITDYEISEGEFVYDYVDTGDGRFWHAKQGDFVSFLFEDFHNHQGFGGSAFKLKTKQSHVLLHGPWSSRPAVYNQLLRCNPDFEPVVDCVINKRVCYITVSALAKLLPDGVFLVCVDENNKVYPWEKWNEVPLDVEFSFAVSNRFDSLSKE